MSAHQALRAATRAAHDAVDRRFAGLSLDRPADYGRFLLAHAAAFLPAEQALTDAGAGSLIDDWDQLRRSPALHADLDALGLRPPPPAEPPAYADEAAVLGGAYVIEGSRLGGALLRRQVAPGLPRAFLDSVQPPARWRRLLALLDRALADRAAIARATEAALGTFALFRPMAGPVNE